MSGRILYLNNNRLLHETEVACFIKMGYEIYVPKHSHFHYGLLQDEITNQYDESLSLADDVLKHLNSTNFWNPIELSNALPILNYDFEAVIVPFEPALISILLHGYKGMVLCRITEYERHEGLTKVLCTQYPYLIKEIEAESIKFRFVFQYAECLSQEDNWLKRHSVFIPVDTRDLLLSEDDKYTDFDFVLWNPNIEYDAVNRSNYEDMKDLLSEFDCCIAGYQLINVSDNNYHPIESHSRDLIPFNCKAVIFSGNNNISLPPQIVHAIRNGVPVLYPEDSIFYSLFFGEQSGFFKSTKELKSILLKCKRSARFRKQLSDKQREILQRHSDCDMTPHWRSVLSLKDHIQLSQDNRSFSLALIIPSPYTGGVLDFTIRLARAIATAAKENNDSLKVIIYHPENDVYKNNNYFSNAKIDGIKIRSFHWSKKGRDWQHNYWKLRNLPPITDEEELQIIEDGMSNLLDVDYAILTAEVMGYYYLPVRHSVVCHDAIQRIVPEVMVEAAEGARQNSTRTAEKIIVTTPPMMDTISCFLGIPSERLVYMPQLIDMISPNENLAKSDEKYFLWATNLMPHKNHLFALNAIEKYYRLGGSLSCIITGAETEWINPSLKLDEEHSANSYLVKIRSRIEASHDLRDHLMFRGNLRKEEYLHLLQGAQFTFHPGYADNGNGAVVDAAQLRVPALSSDYPAMRYMNARMNLQCVFCSWQDDEEMSSALIQMEQNIRSYQNRMMPSDYYEKYSWQAQKDAIYATVKAMIQR